MCGREKCSAVQDQLMRAGITALGRSKKLCEISYEKDKNAYSFVTWRRWRLRIAILTRKNLLQPVS